MVSQKSPKSGATVLRIILFANLIVIMAYGAIEPHQMSKVTAECVTIGIAGLAMAIQVYITLSVFTSLPYNIWGAIGLDALCAAGLRYYHTGIVLWFMRRAMGIQTHGSSALMLAIGIKS